MIIRGLQGRPGQFEEDVPPVKKPALDFKESVFTLDEREKALLGSTLTLSSLSLSREMDFSCRIHDAFLTSCESPSEPRVLLVPAVDSVVMVTCIWSND